MIRTNIEHRGRLLAFGCLLILGTLASAQLGAEDWPEFRGAGRLGIWKETGIVDKFPEGGLTPAWRTPINGGYASAAVSNGRVFVTDAKHKEKTFFLERAMALDEKTGKILWTIERESNYAEMVATWAVGPVATPSVDGDRVYFMLRMGDIIVARVSDGTILWERDFVNDYKAVIPQYGWTGSTLVDGDNVICMVGGSEGASKVVAFDKMTGKEVWRSLEMRGDHGYVSPLIIDAGGTRQLIVWHPTNITSLDPKTGRIFWDIPWVLELGLTQVTPVQSGNLLFFASHYSGARVLQLDEKRPDATLLWSAKPNEDLINPWSSTPIIDGDYVYGYNSFGVLRCVEIKTGKLVWETQAVTKEHALWASAYPTRHEDKYFILNDRGELIIAKMSPKGYEEISRTKVIKPTHAQPRRREFGSVSWTEAVYANKHVIIRNNEEIVSYSLAKP